jgi:hypothetical protein
MRTDIYGTSVLVKDGRHGCTVYMRDNIYGTSVLLTVIHDSPDTSRGRMCPLSMIILTCVKYSLQLCLNTFIQLTTRVLIPGSSLYKYL